MPGAAGGALLRPVAARAAILSLQARRRERARTAGASSIYFKCWQCHNEFQKTAPQLTGLYQNGRQVAGEPVTDAVLTNKIRNGGAGMPAFRHELKDADIADIVSFLREKCCWDPENPPREPALSCVADTVGRHREGQSARRPLGLRAFRRRRTAAAIRGGVEGVSQGRALEGMMVQLRGQQVQHHHHGLYRRAGPLRISEAQCRLLHAADRTRARIQALSENDQPSTATAKLDDIVLERVSNGEFVPAEFEIEAQLAGAELVWNLDGTAQEKRTFSYGCGSGCHTYRADPAQPLRRGGLARDGHQDDPLDRFAAAARGEAEPHSARGAGHHRQMAHEGPRARMPRTWATSSCPARAARQRKSSSPNMTCRA